MNIKNSELETLIECEDYLYNVLVKPKQELLNKCYIDSLEEDKDCDLFYKYNTLIENLITRRNENAKKSYERIKKKRKINKSYARKKKD